MAIGLPEPSDLAKRIGLRYANDNEQGITRRRCGRGFVYLLPDGQRVRKPEVLQRINSMAIPPAWEEVWICQNTRGHIQATGRDDKNRKQYIYHKNWQMESNKLKFAGLVEFADLVPKIRKTVSRTLTAPPLDREQLLALLVWILDLTGMRIGNEEYADDNNSYGLTTLRKRHLYVNGHGIEFRYVGKSGQKQRTPLNHPKAVRLLRYFHQQPGRILFQYDVAGKKRAGVTSEDVNRFLQEITNNDQVTAKDFRTWKGTALATQLLANRAQRAGQQQRDQEIREVICTVAETLGNTPTVCRNYYIHPGIIEAYEIGKFQEFCCEARLHNKKWLSKPEQLLTKVLQTQANPS